MAILTFDCRNYDKVKEYLSACTDDELVGKKFTTSMTAQEVRERIAEDIPMDRKQKAHRQQWLRDKLMLAVAAKGDRFLYLNKETKISYLEGDYETGRVVFLIPEDLTKEEILENRIHFVKMAMLDIVKKAKVSSKMLEVTEFIWRKNFHEVQVTIRLKQEILDLKEKWSEVEAI